ncbi:MAG: histidine phosphatase family protein [Chromatiales bacterium]|nr:histidine phosphatase family protein [Gammaproteobacteria bacterium]MBW6476104.1 histidine phosphatase family protein [Chromatiales bacterium]
MLMLLLPGSHAAEQETLLKALAEGGKVIMMRHASTEAAEPVVSMNLSGNCSEEQNLSAEGKAEARAIAEAFKKHGIQIDKVYSSEFCRARDTAQIAFGGAESWAALNLAESMDAGDSAFLMLDVQEKLGDFSGKGNLVMVTHRSNINTIVFQQIDAGDMVVINPNGTEVLGVLKAEQLRR